MNILSIAIVIALMTGINSCDKKEAYREGYDQGKMDAQNECVDEQEFQKETFEQRLREETEYLCNIQKRHILNNCNQFCGKKK
jgi:hypothetical protein